MTEEKLIAPVDALVMLPCPCCGGEVQVDDPEAHERRVGYRIECEPCYLSMWAFAGENPESLVKRWNSRNESFIETAGIACMKYVQEALRSSGDESIWPWVDGWEPFTRRIRKAFRREAT